MTTDNPTRDGYHHFIDGETKSHKEKPRAKDKPLGDTGSRLGCTACMYLFIYLFDKDIWQANQIQH